MQTANVTTSSNMTKQEAAIKAITDFQERSLTEFSIYEEYRMFIHGVNNGLFDWGHGNRKMADIALATLVAITDPKVMELFPQHLRTDDLPNMLAEMHHFFTRMENNSRAEAAAELEYVEEYGPDDQYCDQLIEYYSNKTDGCIRGTIKVVSEQNGQPASVTNLRQLKQAA